MKLDITNNTLNENYNRKICLISDIHFYKNYNIKILTKLLNNIRKNNPDYICIPGDLIDNADISDLELEPFYDFIRQLGEISTVIISGGNHDIMKHRKYYNNQHFFDKLKTINNVFVLNNEVIINNKIRFIGYMEDYDTFMEEYGHEQISIENLNKLLNIDNNYYNILLAHNPIHLTKKKVYKNIKNWSKLSLVLCGHTHGGLTPSFIKTNRGLISPSKHFFKNNLKGSVIKDKVNIIICSGVVKLSNESGLFHHFNNLYKISINYIYIKV